MSTTIKQIEGAPASYPDAPENLSTAAAALDPAMIWQRIESYIAHRFSERAVTWIVEGPGEWCPPLSPATITEIEIWTGSAWEACEVPSAPLGYVLPGHGPYRITGNAGDDEAEVPEVVVEAYRRLAEYSAARPGKAGATSESISAGSITLAHRRSASWMAQAMQNSGAADLLRPFRRA